MAYTMYKAIKRVESALYFQFLVHLIVSSHSSVISSCLIVIRPRISHHLGRPLNRASLVLSATILFPKEEKRTYLSTRVARLGLTGDTGTAGGTAVVHCVGVGVVVFVLSSMSLR